MADNQDKEVISGGAGKPYQGRVVYLYAYDLAYDMKREQLKTLLGQPLNSYLIGPSKRVPRDMFFYGPQKAEFPPETRHGPHGMVDIRKSVKLFNVGAISIQVSVPFSVDNLAELVEYHDIRFATGGLENEIKEFAEEIQQELMPNCIRPVIPLAFNEAYTVFCFEKLPLMDVAGYFRTEDWLKGHRREVAGLLLQEEDAANLSEQEAEESTEHYLSYYDRDLVVSDWDAAFVVSEKEEIDDILHVMELANVQLVELAAYDRLLDESLQGAYPDVARKRVHVKRDVRRRLREMHVDLPRLSDELLNITKFFGDWHLARIYESVSDRFHLADWHRIIREKLKTLGDLYQLLQQDWMNFWMAVLEATIVALFVIDLLVIIFQK